MSTLDKLIKKFFSDATISYNEAESILLKLGFQVRISGSHHIFNKAGYTKNITLKKRSRLLPYQIKMIKEVLQDHDYEK